MRLRLATPEDTDAVATLFRRSFGSIGFLPTLHTPEEDRWFFARVVADADVWVAEEDGRVLGVAALSGRLLDHFYVEPGDFGRGMPHPVRHEADLRI